MSPGCCVQLVEFGGPGQAHLEHLRPHGADQVGADSPARVAGLVHLHPGFYPDIVKSRLAEELRYPPADPRVGAVAAEGHREDVAEPVEGRVARVAQAMLGVGFRGRYPAAGPGQPHHLGGCAGGVGEVDQQRAGVYQVKGVRWQSGPPGVCGHDLHAAQPPPGGELGGHGGMRRVGVQADNPASRCDPLGQQVQDAARAAAQIDHGLSRLQANPVQQVSAVGGQFVSLTLQPGALAWAAAQRVDGVRVLTRCRARSRADRFGHAAPPRDQARLATRYISVPRSAPMTGRPTAVRPSAAPGRCGGRPYPGRCDSSPRRG